MPRTSHFSAPKTSSLSSTPYTTPLSPRTLKSNTLYSDRKNTRTISIYSDASSATESRFLFVIDVPRAIVAVAIYTALSKRLCISIASLAPGTRCRISRDRAVCLYRSLPTVYVLLRVRNLKFATRREKKSVKLSLLRIYFSRRRQSDSFRRCFPTKITLLLHQNRFNRKNLNSKTTDEHKKERFRPLEKYFLPATASPPWSYSLLSSS